MRLAAALGSVLLALVGLAVDVWATTRHRPSNLTLAGVALAVAGIMLVLNVFSGAHINIIGVGWGLAAAICAACYFVMSDRVSVDGDGLGSITLATSGRGDAVERVTAASVATLRAGLLGEGDRIPCDLLLVSGGWNPAVHLFSHAGGKLRYDEDRGAFVPGEDLDGTTVAGAAAGAVELSDCLDDGRRAVEAVAREREADHVAVRLRDQRDTVRDHVPHLSALGLGRVFGVGQLRQLRLEPADERHEQVDVLRRGVADGHARKSSTRRVSCAPAWSSCSAK